MHAVLHCEASQNLTAKSANARRLLHLSCHNYNSYYTNYNSSITALPDRSAPVARVCALLAANTQVTWQERWANITFFVNSTRFRCFSGSYRFLFTFEALTALLRVKYVFSYCFVFCGLIVCCKPILTTSVILVTVNFVIFLWTMLNKHYKNNI